MKTSLLLTLVVSAFTMNSIALAADTAPEVRTVYCKVDMQAFTRSVRKRIYKEVAEYSNIQVQAIYVNARRQTLVKKEKTMTDWSTGLALGNLGEPSLPLLVGGNLEAGAIAEHCTVPVTVRVRILAVSTETGNQNRYDRRALAYFELPGVYR